MRLDLSQVMASLVGDPICKKCPELAVKVNQDGAKRMIDTLDSLGVKRFVFTSTCSNYGIHNPSMLATETSDLNPQSLYAKTKIEVEKHLLAASASADFTGTVLRMATHLRRYPGVLPPPPRPLLGQVQPDINQGVFAA